MIKIPVKDAPKNGELYEGRPFSDVTIVVDNEKFALHRTYLAYRSLYFSNIFSGKFAESNEKEITLKEVHLKSFKIILNFIYGGDLIVDSNDVNDLTELLKLTRYFQMDNAFDAVKDHLLEIKLKINEIIPLCNAADLLNSKDLMDKLLQETGDEESNIFQQTSFETLSEKIVVALLDKTDLNAKEIDVFNALVNWIKANDYQQPKKLVSKIRLDLISNNDLYKIVLPTNYIDYEEMMNVIDVRDHTPYIKEKRGEKVCRQIFSGVNNPSKVFLEDLPMDKWKENVCCSKNCEIFFYLDPVETICGIWIVLDKFVSLTIDIGKADDEAIRVVNNETFVWKDFGFEKIQAYWIRITSDSRLRNFTLKNLYLFKIRKAVCHLPQYKPKNIQS